MSSASSSKPTAAAAAVAKPMEAPRPVLFTFEAIRPTWLKKSSDQADDLPEDEKVAVPAGKQLQVLATKELQGDAHELIELSHQAGTWHVFAPHFRRIQAAPTAPPATVPASTVPGTVDWGDFSALVTPNLTVGEVLQFDHRRRPSAQSSAVLRILGTAREFQAIRNTWQRRLGMTSFYRPEPINREIGGVANSFHVPGLAMDIYPVGMPLDALYQFLIGRWTGGFGDGRHRGFLHLDRRNGGHFVPGGGARPAAFWRY